MRRDVVIAIAAIAAGASLVLAACGAENVDAPKQVIANPDAAQCKNFDQLLPNFVALINQGRTQNLACVVKTHLLKGRTEAEPPPINDVLRALFALMNGFARGNAEPGAAKGQLCAPDEPQSGWPALSQANELCELRRTLYVLVHQGKGIDAVNLLDPQVSGAINYIVGKGKDATPHYEVAGIVSKMCSQNAQCQLSNGLDLLIGLSSYLEGAAGKKTLDDLRTLLKSAAIQSFLNSSGPDSLTEDGAVALAKILLPAIQNASAADLQNLLEQPPLNNYKTELQPIVDDLKVVISTPMLINPLKKTLNCLTFSDPNYDLVRMLYRLGLRDKLPEFGITRLSQLLDDIQSLDSRGAIVHLLGTISSAVRADETAVDSAASVCQTLFSTKVDSGQAKSNAELALPVVGDLFGAGVASELVCALDTLVWGCAGGAQPACPANPRPPPASGTPVVIVCSESGAACCTHCGSKTPCGDSCITAGETCSLAPGCACK